jgi:hypothetical protein
VLDPELVPVVPTRRAAFQGWRYLEPKDTPADIIANEQGELPPEDMMAELKNLGLI